MHGMLLYIVKYVLMQQNCLHMRGDVSEQISEGAISFFFSPKTLCLG